jgi:hypothetical protein
MRIPFGKLLALAAVAALPVAARADDQKPGAAPMLVVRLQSIDGLVGHAKYLAALAGQEEGAKQFAGIYESMVTEKGLFGIDVKKPFALYGTFTGGPDSPVVLMLPIADEKAFLEQLAVYNVKAEKDGDVYKAADLPIPSPVPVTLYFRFTDGYAYITANEKGNIAKAKLQKPADILPPDATAVASLHLRLDQIPDQFKQMALQQLDLQLAKAKDEQGPANETALQKKFRLALLEALGGRVKSVLTDGRELALRLSIDQKADDLAIDLSLSGKPGSALAKGLAGLGGANSPVAGILSPTAALNLAMDLSLPDDVRKALDPVIDEGFKQALAQVKEEAQRPLAKQALEALAPTLKAGDVSIGVSLRGPSKDDQFGALIAVKVREGSKLEASFREAVKGAKEADRAKLTLDAAKAGTVSLHKIDVGQDADADFKKRFGTGPAYLAFRDDAVVLAFGPEAESLAKEGASAPAKAAPLLAVRASAARLAPFDTNDQTTAKKAAREVFAGAKPGDDAVTFSVESGSDGLRIKASMKGLIVKFTSKLEQLRKGADQEEK